MPLIMDRGRKVSRTLPAKCPFWTVTPCMRPPKMSPCINAERSARKLTAPWRPHWKISRPCMSGEMAIPCENLREPDSFRIEEAASLPLYRQQSISAPCTSISRALPQCQELPSQPGCGVAWKFLHRLCILVAAGIAPMSISGASLDGTVSFCTAVRVSDPAFAGIE
jgi:hypothetical protein